MFRAEKILIAVPKGQVGSTDSSQFTLRSATWLECVPVLPASTALVNKPVSK